MVCIRFFSLDGFIGVQLLRLLIYSGQWPCLFLHKTEIDVQLGLDLLQGGPLDALIVLQGLLLLQFLQLLILVDLFLQILGADKLAPSKSFRLQDYKA